ncbi:hypothetical protein [Nocardia heshunensis]
MAEDVAPEAKEPVPVTLQPEEDAASRQFGEIGADPLVDRSQGLSFDSDVNVDFSYAPSWGETARKAKEPEA